jgi:hypothetical protein
MLPCARENTKMAVRVFVERRRGAAIETLRKIGEMDSAWKGSNERVWERCWRVRGGGNRAGFLSRERERSEILEGNGRERVWGRVRVLEKESAVGGKERGREREREREYI